MIHTYYTKPDANYNRRHIAFLGAIGAAIGVGSVSAAGVATVGATLAGAAIVGTAAYGASKLLLPSTPKPPQIQGQAAVKAAEPSIDKAKAAAELNIVQKRRSIARNRSVFTSPTGLTIEDKSNLTLKTLTGV